MTEPLPKREDGMTPRPDIAANAIYPLLARVSLFELHANLLELLRKNLSALRGPKNLVVVGPGAEALPFSAQLETTTSLLDGGNLILLDYNREICDKLPAYLEKAGFGRRFMIERRPPGEMTDLRGLRDTVTVMEWDIRDGLPFPAGSVDAIDMTLSIHHVTGYESDVATLFGHAARVLADGGILHVGEGNVDMKYSERKIGRLTGDVSASGVRGVLVSDGRDAGSPPRQWRVGEGEGEATMRITETGMVGISHPACDALAVSLGAAGYKQLYVADGTAVLPLIDHAMEDDFREMIVPVRAFYVALSELCLRRLEPVYHEEFFRVLHKEQSDAERGIVEYYSPPSMLCAALGACGFTVDERRYTENGPFVNILAVKRTP